MGTLEDGNKRRMSRSVSRCSSMNRAKWALPAPDARNKSVFFSNNAAAAAAPSLSFSLALFATQCSPRSRNKDFLGVEVRSKHQRKSSSAVGNGYPESQVGKWIGQRDKDCDFGEALGERSIKFAFPIPPSIDDTLSAVVNDIGDKGVDGAAESGA